MIDENPPIQPKRRSPCGASRPIQIQERDLAILYSLSVGRYLTASAIEWLHYPTWRERYKAYLERQKTDESLVYRPLNHVYRRLIALRAGEVPLVYRLTRANERARLAYARLADAYVLAEAGAELLCTQHGYEISDLWYEDPRKRSIKNFEHSVAIGTCYAALRASLEFSGQQLTDWRGDHLLARRDAVNRSTGATRALFAGHVCPLPAVDAPAGPARRARRASPRSTPCVCGLLFCHAGHRLSASAALAHRGKRNAAPCRSGSACRSASRRHPRSHPQVGCRR